WNACSLTSRLTELEFFMVNNNVVVAAIQETWLVQNDSLFLRDINIIRCDRPDGTPHGEVALLIHKNLNYSHYTLQYTGAVAAVAIRLIPSNLIVISAYSLPAVRLTSDILNKLTSHGSPFLISGDFNFKHQLWNNFNNNSNGHELKKYSELATNDALFSNAHTHLVPNRQPATIDFFLSNLNHYFTCSTLDELSSDHLPVMLSPSSNTNPKTTTSIPVTDWDTYRNLTLNRPITHSISSAQDVNLAISSLIRSLRRSFFQATNLVPMPNKFIVADCK
ncbi:RNA-directed DNA polymerase from mobile element jockey, partial [Habropoda laboriosa]